MIKPDSFLHKLQILVYKLAMYFEIVVALFVIAGIVICFMFVPSNLITVLHTNGTVFNNFLKVMFNIIIGIELLKMLCRHDLDSVVEVLLFAVARGLIIEHHSTWETLVGIVSIALLFVVRKFLFVSAIDKQDDEIDRGSDH